MIAERSTHTHCWSRIEELNERVGKLLTLLRKSQERARDAERLAAIWESRFHGNPRRLNGGGTLRQRGLCAMCGVKWDERTANCGSCRARHRERNKRAAK